METNERALAAFIGETATAHDRLTALLEHVDDHLEVASEDINWGHVETLKRINALLYDIETFLLS